MGKTLLEFQSNKGDVLPAHKVRNLQLTVPIYFFLSLIFIAVFALSLYCLCLICVEDDYVDAKF